MSTIIIVEDSESGHCKRYTRDLHNEHLIELTTSIIRLVKSLAEKMATKSDLEAVKQEIIMRLSDVKGEVQAMVAELTEGLEEIDAKIGSLIADMADPEVKDPQIVSGLQDLRVLTKKVANTANKEVTPEPGTGGGTEPTDPQVSDPNAPLARPGPAGTSAGAQASSSKPASKFP